METVVFYPSIITLNVNRLQSSIKRQRVAEWIKTQDPTICCLQEIQFSFEGTHRLSVKRCKKTFQSNGNQKKLRGSYTHIRQKRLQPTNDKKRKRRSLYNDKRVNTSRRQTDCKYLFAQHLST